MQSRYNSNQPLPGRDYPVRYPFKFTVQPRPPRQPARSSKPAVAPPATQSGPDSDLILEQEINPEELEEFSAWILSQLSEAGAGYPLETIFKKALSQKLESYLDLRREHSTALEAQKEHRHWSKRIVKAAEPVLKNQAIPDDQKQDLSSLAVSCIEKRWQLNMRVNNLRLRVEFLNQAIPLYLTEHGQLLGAPAQDLSEAAQQLRAFLKQASS